MLTILLVEAYLSIWDYFEPFYGKSGFSAKIGPILNPLLCRAFKIDPPRLI